ncbi:hypothetical protein PR048_009265 [Dryococelus australis]|uniref:Tetraspanin n=1 Tax=Dryococelus australis TaxID=614101 RepID=A0ABQ9HZS5_9NEOP|nr:hypothetical protein PR048_009265 [Dryococelus australis]
MLLTARSYELARVIEVSMKRRRNDRASGTGDPRESLPVASSGMIHTESVQVCGLGVVAAGGAVMYTMRQHEHFVSSPLLATPVVLIIAGCFIFLVAFLGCCGAIRESYNMLIAFAVLLLIIFVVQLAAGIAAGVAKDGLSTALKEIMKDSMDDAAHSRDADVNAWDRLQKEVRCSSPFPLVRVYVSMVTSHVRRYFETMSIFSRSGISH